MLKFYWFKLILDSIRNQQKLCLFKRLKRTRTLFFYRASVACLFFVRLDRQHLNEFILIILLRFLECLLQNLVTVINHCLSLLIEFVQFLRSDNMRILICFVQSLSLESNFLLAVYVCRDGFLLLSLWLTLLFPDCRACGPDLCGSFG